MSDYTNEEYYGRVGCTKSNNRGVVVRTNAGQRRSVRTPQTENRVLQQFADSSSTSARANAADLGIWREMVWRNLLAENKHPFYKWTPFEYSSYAECLMPKRMIRSFSPLFYSQVKPNLPEKVWSTRTMRICGRPKIPQHYFVKSATHVQY